MSGRNGQLACGLFGTLSPLRILVECGNQARAVRAGLAMNEDGIRSVQENDHDALAILIGHIPVD